MRILRCTVGLTLSVCLSLGAASRPQRPTNAEWRRTGNRCQPHMPGSSSLGYERSGVRSQWPIAALVRWRHRGSFLVRWEDIERLDVRRINLRPGFTRVSSQLS